MQKKQKQHWFQYTYQKILLEIRMTVLKSLDVSDSLLRTIMSLFQNLYEMQILRMLVNKMELISQCPVPNNEYSKKLDINSGL